MLGFNRPFCSPLPRNWRTQIDPRDPDYDDGQATAVADEAVEGQQMLQHAPCKLLRVLADFAESDEAFDDAIRELLRPLFNEIQSHALAKLHAEFSKSDEALDLAAEVLQIA